MISWNDYLLEFYYYMTLRLTEIISLLEKGDLDKKGLYRYILVSKALEKLERYDPDKEDDAQEYPLNTYIEIQTILNVYLDINITYHEFTYSK